MMFISFLNFAYASGVEWKRFWQSGFFMSLKYNHTAVAFTFVLLILIAHHGTAL
ncbi:hypothetical protein [Pontibacter rugosus]